MRPKSNRQNASPWLKILPLIIFLFLWYCVGRYVERGAYFYGSPALVVKALKDQIDSGVLWKNIYYTLSAVIFGFLAGNILGIVTGLAFAYWPRFASVCRPYLTVLSCVPIIAFAPIIVLVFGIQFLPKLALATFSTFVIAVSQTFEGALQTPPGSLALLDSLGASRFTVFRKAVIPSSLVWVFSGLRLNVGVAILAVFIAEFITSHPGIGYQIIVDMGLFKTSSVLAGVVVISIMSLILTGCIGWIQTRFSHLRRTD